MANNTEIELMAENLKYFCPNIAQKFNKINDFQCLASTLLLTNTVLVAQFFRLSFSGKWYGICRTKQDKTRLCKENHKLWQPERIVNQIDTNLAILRLSVIRP